MIVQPIDSSKTGVSDNNGSLLGCLTSFVGLPRCCVWRLYHHLEVSWLPYQAPTQCRDICCSPHDKHAARQSAASALGLMHGLVWHIPAGAEGAAAGAQQGGAAEERPRGADCQGHRAPHQVSRHSTCTDQSAHCVNAYQHNCMTPTYSSCGTAACQRVGKGTKWTRLLCRAEFCDKLCLDDN